MIRIENLRKTYPTRFGEKLVLDDINFELAKGEKLGILGRNGAGKSTLVRLISGAEYPTSGRISSDISISWPLAFGGAFQDTLTGIDNVRFISRVYQQDFEQNLKFVEDFAELGGYLREEVRTYSSGMKARLAFAISLIIEFDCFLIDEVGAVGDARFHARCNFELFEKRADRSMIIISHDANYVRNHCDRWAVLDEGRLTPFSDFDEAYDFFFQRIGLSEPANETGKRKKVKFADRARSLESVRRLAFADDRFRVLVQKADWARDSQDWATAQKLYTDALGLYPYESSYWGQLGNARREQGNATEAELAYRTACALGEPPTVMSDFVDHVIRMQGDDPAELELRSLAKGLTADQPPAFPDIGLLATLFWGEIELGSEEALQLMRQSPTLDHLAYALLTDSRMDWQGDRQLASSTLNEEQAAKVFEQLSMIILPATDGEEVASEQAQSEVSSTATLRSLYDAGAFLGWAKTRAKLTEKLPSSH